MNSGVMPPHSKKGIMGKLIEKMVTDLTPGEVIGKPVYTEDGEMLIEADAVIMGRHIALLEANDVYLVIVDHDGDLPAAETEAEEAGLVIEPRMATLAAEGDDLLLAILREAEVRNQRPTA
jgi:hypothetical protein